MNGVRGRKGVICDYLARYEEGNDDVEIETKLEAVGEQIHDCIRILEGMDVEHIDFLNSIRILWQYASIGAVDITEIEMGLPILCSIAFLDLPDFDYLQRMALAIMACFIEVSDGLLDIMAIKLEIMPKIRSMVCFAESKVVRNALMVVQAVAHSPEMVRVISSALSVSCLTEVLTRHYLDDGVSKVLQSLVYVLAQGDIDGTEHQFVRFVSFCIDRLPKQRIQWASMSLPLISQSELGSQLICEDAVIVDYLCVCLDNGDLELVEVAARVAYAASRYDKSIPGLAYAHLVTFFGDENVQNYGVRTITNLMQNPERITFLLESDVIISLIVCYRVSSYRICCSVVLAISNAVLHAPHHLLHVVIEQGGLDVLFAGFRYDDMNILMAVLKAMLVLVDLDSVAMEFTAKITADDLFIVRYSESSAVTAAYDSLCARLTEIGEFL